MTKGVKEINMRRICAVSDGGDSTAVTDNKRVLPVKGSARGLTEIN